MKHKSQYIYIFTAVLKKKRLNLMVILTCGKFGTVIRMLMPLVITEEQLETGLKIIEENLQILASKTDY